MRVILLTVTFFTAVFGIVSIVFYFGEWDRLVIVTVMGVFVGLVAAPQIEPKVFKRGWLWQLASGAAFGGLIAYVSGGEFQVIASSIVIGGILGVSTPIWFKYIQIP